MTKSLRALIAHFRRSNFRGSKEYWQHRYSEGGTSGRGSYGEYAVAKARVINTFVVQHEINSVIEFGCGDGNQLSRAVYPRYLGLDVSDAAINICRQRFMHDESKSFMHLDDYSGQTADLALSLDVIYHLVEDTVFERHIQLLFAAGQRYVIIFSTNTGRQARLEGAHVRHRPFVAWLEANVAGWELIRTIAGPGGSKLRADFFVFARRS